MRHLLLIALMLFAFGSGCSHAPTTPSPPAVSSMAFTAVSPASGSTILLPWSFLPAGWTTSYAVTGFRVYRLPCEVTGVRAMLHMRNNGLNIPPTPSETIAEATLPVSYRILR